MQPCMVRPCIWNDCIVLCDDLWLYGHSKNNIHAIMFNIKQLELVKIIIYKNADSKWAFELQNKIFSYKSYFLVHTKTRSHLYDNSNNIRIWSKIYYLRQRFLRLMIYGLSMWLCWVHIQTCVESIATLMVTSCLFCYVRNVACVERIYIGDGSRWIISHLCFRCVIVVWHVTNVTEGVTSTATMSLHDYSI